MAKVREQIDFAKLRQQANEIARRKADELTAAKEAERKRLSEKAEFDRQVSMAVEERIKQLRKQWIKAEFDRPWFRSAAILVGLLAIALAILLSRQRYQLDKTLILDTRTGKASLFGDAPPIWPERRK